MRLGKLAYSGPAAVAKPLAPAGPAYPPARSWQGRFDAWQILGNDRFGDCTTAAACHMLMCWRLVTQGEAAATAAATEAQALAAYARAIRDFDPADPATYNFDTGALLQDVLHNWKRIGIAGVRVDGYGMLPFSDRETVKQTIALFGGCCIGLQLPRIEGRAGPPITVDQDVNWDLSKDLFQGDGYKKDSRLGHCVFGVGYDDKGLDVVSWGTVKRMSWDFYDAYMDEAYAILCRAAWVPAGNAPSGLNADQLVAAGKALTTMWIS